MQFPRGFSSLLNFVTVVDVSMAASGFRLIPLKKFSIYLIPRPENITQHHPEKSLRPLPNDYIKHHLAPWIPLLPSSMFRALTLPFARDGASPASSSSLAGQCELSRGGISPAFSEDGCPSLQSICNPSMMKMESERRSHHSLT